MVPGGPSHAVKSQPYMLWLDCRNINDPGVRPEFCSHIGEHVGILKNLLKAPGLEGLMKQVKDWSAGHTTPDAQPIEGGVTGLGYVCVSGTHRSIGVNRLLSECLKRDGHQVRAPHHLSRGKWARKGRCYWCNSCNLQNAAKGAVFAEAYRMWSAI